ncbi:MAG TPA: peptidylprolyl isomerase [Candidatus Binataceae bacterium]|nr:peptidylprolyl isomerase [Candidatus Binataceae bacterium]
MLDYLRKRNYSTGSRVIILILGGVLTLSLAGFGAASYFSQPKTVASVDCYTYFGLITLPGCRNILPDEVDQQADNIRRAIQNSRGADAAAQLLQGVNLRGMAVESLVEQTVIQNQAHKLGLEISDEDLAKAIASQAVFQVDGRFDETRYYQLLRENRLDPADFESETRGKMLSEQLQHFVTAAVSVSSDEAHAEFNRLGERVSLAYLEFPLTNFTPARPTDAEVAKFYQDNKDSFREPQRFKIEFIRYDLAVLEPKEAPGDEDVKNYYEQNLKQLFSHPEQIHVRHILIPVAADASAAEKAAAKSRAEDLLQKVKGGAPIGDLAKQYSGDPGSAQNGGDLGYVSKGELVQPFEDVAFKLKPGEVGLAETQYGFHVIEVVDAKGAKVEDVIEAKPKIIAALKHKQAIATARQDVEQDEAAAGLGKDFKDLAQKRGLTAVTTPYFAQEDTIKGAEDDPGLKKEILTMKTGEIRSVKKTETPFLVKIVDEKPARLPPLDEITASVVAAIMHQRAQKMAREAAEAMLKQIKSPEAFDALATSNHLQVKTTGDFVRARGDVPGIGSFPEAAQASGTVTSVPGVVDHVLENGGNAYIVKVLSRNPPDSSEWKSIEAQFTARMLQERQQAAWSNYVNELKRKALIVVHSDLLGVSATDS